MENVLEKLYWTESNKNKKVKSVHGNSTNSVKVLYWTTALGPNTGHTRLTQWTPCLIHLSLSFADLPEYEMNSIIVSRGGNLKYF